MASIRTLSALKNPDLMYELSGFLERFGTGPTLAAIAAAADELADHLTDAKGTVKSISSLRAGAKDIQEASRRIQLGEDNQFGLTLAEAANELGQGD
jgi:hypothetical protein